MQKFKVQVTEKLRRIIEIKAETQREAVDIAKKRYNDADFILDWKDHAGTTFKIKKEKKRQ